MKEEHKPFVFKSALLGYVAMWATRQSPYYAPDGLTEVLAELDQRLNLKPYDQIEATRENLQKLLKEKFLTIYQVQKWNERKNGNTYPLHFTSRYDTNSNPDDDFIDLDALVRNIVHSCIQEDRENWEDHVESLRWTFSKWWWNMKLKLFPSIYGPNDNIIS